MVPVWGNWFLKSLGYLAAIAVTSIVAQLSVAPFSLFHFQSISIAGVIANVVALPIVSFLVMPSLLLGVFSEAIGGLQLLSGVVGVGLDLVLYIAAEAGALPYALLYVTPLSIGVFGFAVFSLLLLLIYRSVLSNWLIAAVLLVFFIVQIQTREGVLISRSGHMLMVHMDGKLYVRGGRKNSFRNRVWAQYWGQSPNEVSEPLVFYCDDSGCGYDLFDNQSFSLQRVKVMAGIRRACINHAVVVIPDKYAHYCLGASVLIKESTLERQGPLALMFDKENNMTIKWSNP